MRKLAETLQEAHAKGGIHRNLKPANILIELASSQHLPGDQSRQVVKLCLALPKLGVAEEPVEHHWPGCRPAYQP